MALGSLRLLSNFRSSGFTLSFAELCRALFRALASRQRHKATSAPTSLRMLPSNVPSPRFDAARTATPAVSCTGDAPGDAPFASSTSSPPGVLRVGGVPEHFNLPWHLAIERGVFASHDVAVEWVSQPMGTGQMVASLKSGACDVVVALTEVCPHVHLFPLLCHGHCNALVFSVAFGEICRSDASGEPSKLAADACVWWCFWPVRRACDHKACSGSMHLTVCRYTVTQSHSHTVTQPYTHSNRLPCVSVARASCWKSPRAPLGLPVTATSSSSARTWSRHWCGRCLRLGPQPRAAVVTLTSRPCAAPPSACRASAPAPI